MVRFSLISNLICPIQEKRGQMELLLNWRVRDSVRSRPQSKDATSSVRSFILIRNYSDRRRDRSLLIRRRMGKRTRKRDTRNDDLGASGQFHFEHVSFDMARGGK